MEVRAVALCMHACQLAKMYSVAFLNQWSLVA